MKSELLALGVLCLLAPLVSSTRLSVPSEESASSSTIREPLSDADSNTLVAGSTDTADDASSYFPWTHKPVCTEFLEGVEDKLCVYTNATFSNGRGISIFTTPKVAEEFASLPAFQNGKALSSEGINPKYDKKKSPWYTTSIPNKGVGMFASRPLQRGDQATAYTPFLLVHMENVLTTDQREQFLRIALDQLPPSSRETYLSLAKIYNIPSVAVQDVVKANAFEIQVGGIMHLAVFPESSRFNHDCAPNAQYFLSTDLLTHFIHAVRPISKDEELTISYAPPLRMHVHRQQYLEETFHFKCACSRCSSADRSVEVSDQATHDIMALQYLLGQWNDSSTNQPTIKQAEMLVRLYKEEGLDAFLDDAYGHAALMYNSVGSARGTIKYAELAAEASFLKYGPSDGKVDEWRAIMRDPTSHGSWKRRRPESGSKTEL